MAHHNHAAGAATAAVTFAELRNTAAQLERARTATAKYADVRVARKDGYSAIGPYEPGMGFHYVRKEDALNFDIEHPPILLYEKDSSAPQGLRLIGVSYLWDAPAGPDGQPKSAPFPKGLASWHKHNNVCVLPDDSAKQDAEESGCKKAGGEFIPETEWMVHAWIFKDSPDGVFSPTNPTVH